VVFYYWVLWHARHQGGGDLAGKSPGRECAIESGPTVAPKYPPSTAAATHNTGARRATIVGADFFKSCWASGLTPPILANPSPAPIILLMKGAIPAVPWSAGTDFCVENPGKIGLARVPARKTRRNYVSYTRRMNSTTNLAGRPSWLCPNPLR